jgi:hypothetical protein
VNNVHVWLRWLAIIVMNATITDAYPCHHTKFIPNINTLLCHATCASSREMERLETPFYERTNVQDLILSLNELMRRAQQNIANITAEVEKFTEGQAILKDEIKNLSNSIQLSSDLLGFYEKVFQEHGDILELMRHMANAQFLTGTIRGICRQCSMLQGVNESRARQGWSTTLPNRERLYSDINPFNRTRAEATSSTAPPPRTTRIRWLDREPDYEKTVCGHPPETHAHGTVQNRPARMLSRLARTVTSPLRRSRSVIFRRQ